MHNKKNTKIPRIHTYIHVHVHDIPHICTTYPFTKRDRNFIFFEGILHVYKNIYTKVIYYMHIMCVVCISYVMSCMYVMYVHVYVCMYVVNLGVEGVARI